MLLNPRILRHQVLQPVRSQSLHDFLLQLILWPVSHDLLQQQEAEELRIKVGWGFVKDRNVDFVGVLRPLEQHSLVKSGLDKAGRIFVGLNIIDFDVLIHIAQQLLVLQVSAPRNDDVLAHIVAVVVIHDHVPGDGLHVFDAAQDRKTELVVLVDPAMGQLNCRLKRSCLLGLDQLSVDGAPLVLHVFVVVEGVRDHVPNNVDALLEVFVEDRHGVAGQLP